jgi:hypothetical protein
MCVAPARSRVALSFLHGQAVGMGPALPSCRLCHNHRPCRPSKSTSPHMMRPAHKYESLSTTPLNGMSHNGPDQHACWAHSSLHGRAVNNCSPGRLRTSDKASCRSPEISHNHVLALYQSCNDTDSTKHTSHAEAGLSMRTAGAGPDWACFAGLAACQAGARGPHVWPQWCLSWLRSCSARRSLLS